MVLKKFQQFFKIANFFYLTIGIIPYDKRDGSTASALVNFIFYFCMINLNLNFLGEFIYATLAFRDGRFIEGTMTVSYIGFVSVSDFKMLSAWWKRGEVTDFVHELYALFPKTKEQEKLYQMPRYLSSCTWITSGFSLLYMVLIWTYNLFTMLEYLLYEYWLQVRVVGLKLPYLVYIPWNYHDNWTYYLLYTSQTVAAYQSAAGIIASDLLLSATATQLIMQYDYVARKIRAYTVQDGQGADDMEFIVGIVKYHEKILSLSHMMNKVFGIQLLFNFMTSTAVICFVGFQVTVGDDANELIKPFLFLFSSMAQVYLICHFGEELIYSSESIAAAVYEHDWINADLRYKKMLVLIAQRAQKPAILRATALISISRSTMTDIMQYSYKFFALLRTMYAQ